MVLWQKSAIILKPRADPRYILYKLPNRVEQLTTSAYCDTPSQGNSLRNAGTKYDVIRVPNADNEVEDMAS